MMIQHDSRYPERSESLNDWRARDAARAPVSIYNRQSPVMHDTASTINSRRGSGEWSENNEPNSKKTTGRKPSLHNHIWPLLRSKASRSNIKSTLEQVKEPRSLSQGAIAASPSLRHMPSQPNLTARKPEILSPKKRKASVPDLSVGPMTTVQEGLLDSPTIPHHHPFLQRSMTFPDTVLQRLSEDVSERMPRISDFPKPNVGCCVSSSQAGPQAENSGRTMVSTVSQRALTPLFIPTKAESSNAASTQNSVAQNNEDGKPPKVPPKSPRTESRASPRIKQLPHSASSSTSTTHSVCSSATSANSSLGKISPKPRQHSHTTGIPQDQPGVLDNTESKISGNHLKYLERLGRQTPPHVEGRAAAGPWAGLDKIGRKSPPRVESPTIHHDKLSDTRGIPQLISLIGTDSNGTPRNVQEREQPEEETDPAKQVNKENHVWHQRDISETSLIDRGRPMKRGDTTLIGAISRPNLINLKLTEDNVELPSGVIAKHASTIMPNADLEQLKQDAKLKVDNFEVLSAKDVSNLSKELALLDERCEYLRRTHSSLRQGRQGLHTRMILYLKSPHTSRFSRDSILKQEEALAELDYSIDDWVLKLEQADGRRNRIRQKLLEHFAAALTLRTAQNAHSHHVPNVQTPPMSPEKSEDPYHKQRRDVQSIKVYADWGVPALLSAIEQEIDLIDNSNRVS